MRTKQKLFLLLLLFTSALTFTFYSCSSPTNPDLLPSVSLTVDGVTSTEAFIKLSTNNVSLPASVALSRNNKQINNFTLITADTTIVDENLNPNQSYTYSAELTGTNNQRAVSGSVQIQTLDTTSHNFTWQTFTFGGQGGSSTLYDVAIINENDIWAVGEMYVYDSTGSPVLYNAIHWDGSKWELKRIKTEFRGKIITIELEGVFAFSPTDIWMVGSLPIHGDGQNWTMFDVRTTTDPNLSLSKAWGANTNDMYFVGRGGSIAHYNGSGWQKINSGTDVKLLDVWGTGKNVWISGWEDFKPTVLLKYNNNLLTTVINNPNSNLFSNNPDAVSGAIESIWANNDSKLFLLTWYGLYRIGNDNNGKAKNLWSGDPNNWGLTKVRANNTNDIVAVGIKGRIWHYNGVSWKLYTELINNRDNLRSVAIRNNLIVAVGNRYNNGIENYGLIYVGIRN